MSIFDQHHEDRKVRQFQLSPSFLSEYMGKQPKWGPVGYFTYKRTYSNATCDCENPGSCGHDTEEFWQTLQRVVEGTYHVQKIHCKRMGLPWNEPKAQVSAQEMFRRMWEFKFTPPGRGLSKMGTPFMFEKGGGALNNCGFVSTDTIDEDFAGPFTFLMDFSMLGVGVGGDVAGANTVKLLTPKVTQEVFSVEDSREGWVSVTKTILNSFVGKRSLPTLIDFSRVRPAGARIHGFGGEASGPGPLVSMLLGIIRTLSPTRPQFRIVRGDKGEITTLETVFSEADGSLTKRISSENIVDTFNLIGACVVAGGVRRSSEIMFGPFSDESFRKLKDPTKLYEASSHELLAWELVQAHVPEGLLGQAAKDLAYAWWVHYSELSDVIEVGAPAPQLWTPEPDAELLRSITEWGPHYHAVVSSPLRTHRWVSNNSILAEVGMDYRPVAESIILNGEPGLLWLKNAQQYSRMGDPPDNKDRRAKGANPCSEQTLESYELCCLVETYPAHHDSYEDFQRTLKFAYLYAKSVTLVPTHHPRTNAVMARNRRIGASMSGIRQAIEKFGRRNFLNWCDQGYQYIQDLDVVYSDWLGVPRSIKTTSVKPSGTVSLLCGATPGMHPPVSPYYIRNIRVSANSPLLEACRKAGYTVERDAYAAGTYVVSFPVKVDNCKIGAQDVSIWEQMALAADLQKHWSDNQVSVTITFKPEEAKEIVPVLEAYETTMKSVSFLPLETHGYVQAPYIPITEEQYYEMASRVAPLELAGNTREMEDMFCDGGSCQIKTPAA
jgi:adenosylcobalamin-dependent ribonucleoside-triphosphate reductase